MIFPTVVASLYLVASSSMAVVHDSRPFKDEWLNNRARKLAQSAYVPLSGKVPPSLANLTYDQYRDIRFRADASFWRKAKLPFQVQLFHLGSLFTEPVSLFVVKNRRFVPIRYSADLFDYGKTKVTLPLPNAFAGFRIHNPINRPDYFDEIIAFLGASYFRSLGRGNHYGLSARGLAIDTAVASGEIFPVFREFYIERPKRNASRIVVHALLDSPKVSGAYRFDIHPGENTEIRVDATIYPRETVERLGLAPLTSMFLYGENCRQGFDDFRPEVHDSDGLLVRFGNGEQLWRPLQNPGHLELSVLRSQSIKGFGLMQRDRRPFSYEDLEASYDARPSLWIEPVNFGSGGVYLIEIPSREDINDNIVAFFTPDKKIEPGVPLTFSYKMFWGKSPASSIVASVASTRVGSARRIGVPDDKQPLPRSARKFVIDFAWPGVQSSFKPEKNVEAVVTAANGKVTNVRVQPNLHLKGYRAVFDFVPQGTKPIELRCFLRKKGAALSETWSYRFSPKPGKQAYKMGS